jgi:uncharacterized protein YcnI
VSVRKAFLAAATVLALLVPVATEAHVSITPRQSTTGATEKYTNRIPTEGTVAPRSSFRPA